MRMYGITGCICVAFLFGAGIGCNRNHSSSPATQRTNGWEDYAQKHAADKAESQRMYHLPAKPTLQDYRTYAAMNNLNLQAAFHHWQAAVEDIEQAKSLPDPKITYGYYFLEVETRTGPQKESLSLSQTIPWLGKLILRGDAAAKMAEARWYEFQAEKLKLYAQVEAEYAEYYYLGRAVRVTDDNVKLLQQMEELIRVRYRTAAASHPDLIRVQVELGKLIDRRDTLAQMRKPILAKFQAVIGYDNSNTTPLPWPDEIPYRTVILDKKTLTESMEKNNPLLIGLASETAAAEAKVALAKQEYWPDATIGGTWIDTGQQTGPMKPSDSGQDAVIGAITLNIPIWVNRIDAGIRQANHQRWAAEARRVQTQRDLSARLDEVLFKLEDADRKTRLYRQTLVPKATESLQVIQRGFSTGASNYNDLIDAQRILLEFELSYERALADHAIWRAELERVVGMPLDQPETIPASQPAGDTAAANPVVQNLQPVARNPL